MYVSLALATVGEEQRFLLDKSQILASSVDLWLVKAMIVNVQRQYISPDLGH